VLPDVLASKWNDKDFEAYRAAFPDSDTVSPESFEAHVKDLTQRDVKAPYLKNLQGRALLLFLTLNATNLAGQPSAFML
jgi:hypothetical protein